MKPQQPITTRNERHTFAILTSPLSGNHYMNCSKMNELVQGSLRMNDVGVSGPNETCNEKLECGRIVPNHFWSYRMDHEETHSEFIDPFSPFISDVSSECSIYPIDVKWSDGMPTPTSFVSREEWLESKKGASSVVACALSETSDLEDLFADAEAIAPPSPFFKLPICNDMAFVQTIFQLEDEDMSLLVNTTSNETTTSMEPNTASSSRVIFSEVSNQRRCNFAGKKAKPTKKKPKCSKLRLSSRGRPVKPSRKKKVAYESTK